MSANDFLHYIVDAATLSLLITVGLGVVSWTRLSPSFKVLVAGLGCYLIFLIIFYLHRKEVIQWEFRSYTSYLFALIYGTTFTTLYALALPSGQKRKAIMGLGVVACLYLLADMLVISGLHTKDGPSIILMTIVLIVSTLIFLHYLVVNPTERSLLAVPLFWVATSKLLSGLGNGLFDVFKAQLRAYSDQWLIKTLILVYLVIIVSNILYAVGIWKERRRMDQPLGLRS